MPRPWVSDLLTCRRNISARPATYPAADHLFWSAQGGGSSSWVGAGRLARTFGCHPPHWRAVLLNATCLLSFIAGFPTPPAEPGVRLSPHRALQGPALLPGAHAPGRHPF